MPSLEHEAPLVVLREEPALVPALLRESLGVSLPPFETVEVGEADLGHAQPVERRADLVVRLRAGPPERAPAMGVIVEIQRARDDDKWRSWPLYAASLHARLRCPICLLVIATDDAVARWAATPITTLQVGSAFVRLVLGPRELPRVPRASAGQRPWMAILSGLIHGNRPDGVDAVRSAADALRTLPEGPWRACYDLLYASLGEGPRRILEEQMHFEKYEYRSDFARRAYGDGRASGALEGIKSVVSSLAERHGPIADDLRARIAACDAAEQLRALAVDLAGANDVQAVAALLAALPPPPI